MNHHTHQHHQHTNRHTLLQHQPTNTHPLLKLQYIHHQHQNQHILLHLHIHQLQLLHQHTNLPPQDIITQFQKIHLNSLKVIDIKEVLEHLQLITAALVQSTMEMMTTMIMTVVSTTKAIVALLNQTLITVVLMLQALLNYQEDQKLINDLVMVKVLHQEKFSLVSHLFLGKILEDPNNNFPNDQDSPFNPLILLNHHQDSQTITAHHSSIVLLTPLPQHLHRLYQLSLLQDQLQHVVPCNLFHQGQAQRQLVDHQHKGPAQDLLQQLAAHNHQEAADPLTIKKSLMLFHLDFLQQLFPTDQTLFLKAMVDSLKQTEMFLADLVAMESIRYLVLEGQVAEEAYQLITTQVDHLRPLIDHKLQGHLDHQDLHRSHLTLDVPQQLDLKQTTHRDHQVSDHLHQDQAIHFHQPHLVAMAKETASLTIDQVEHSLLLTDLKALALVIAQAQTPMALDH